VYVAPPDHHLTIDAGVARVMRGPRQNRHRPAIDPLFRSGSRWAGRGTIAVVLSGAAGDGVAGATMVAARGGRILVQDPREALFPGMPYKVLDAVPAATSMTVADMPDSIRSAVDGSASVRVGRAEEEIVAMDEETMPPVEPGRPAYSCPDCGGVLEEIVGDGPLRFRCRVGHQFYAEDLATAQWQTLEDALWSAVRGMEETSELSGRLARIAEEHGSADAARRHRERGHDVLAQSRIIRDFLLSPAAGKGAEAIHDQPRDAARA
jgi:two-component system chemotaxis response regulator CheB